jgi:hypothetical protein
MGRYAQFGGKSSAQTGAAANKTIQQNRRECIANTVGMSEKEGVSMHLTYPE